MPFFSFLFFLSATFLGFIASADVHDHFCGVSIESPSPIKFSAVEKDWLCGKSESASWRTIPITEKQLFLKSFLQSRGYLAPEFREQGEDLVVKTGPLSQVKEFEVQGAPEPWDWKKRRRILGRTLNPGLLDEMTKWSRRQLQFRGYPCPTVQSEALIESQKVLLKVNPGARSTFGDYETQGEEKMDTEILDRYTAFLPGDTFDIRLLELTSNRILQEDLYVSAYFDVLCPQNQNMKIVRRLMPAQPRLLTFGVGFDSEEGPIAESTWKATRLNGAANSFDTKLHASLREQTLESRYHYYLSSSLKSRLQLIPNLKLERTVEPTFETRTSKAGVALGYGWEESTFRPQFEIGPALGTTDLTQGAVNTRVQNVRVETEVNVTSHLFEYNMGDPQTGWNFILDTSSQFQNVVAKKTFHRLTLRHHVYWNLGSLEPPFLILGSRGFIGTFLTDEKPLTADDVPISERLFLGGSQDLRGFSRRSLPGGQEGFLSAVYEGLELRAGEWFNYSIQPLIFIDWAMAGLTEDSFESAYYYSPGVGVRYASPFGPVRATLARGFVEQRSLADPNTGYQLYFSFGREF